MNVRMPRGAIPSPRSELAASEPYEPAHSGEITVPSNDFPTPSYALAAAQPYRAQGAAPESFLAWPAQLASWENGEGSNANWAEEAFAKACAQPNVPIPADIVVLTARLCGSLNVARFMQTHGFQVHGTAYLDGPFYAVDWTDTAALNSAIANTGPVKIGVASAALASALQGKVTPAVSGWAITGVSKGQPAELCASLCGYGSFAALVDLFEQSGNKVNVPPETPSGLCYAMFTSGSIGIIDRESLLNITGEAWVRSPATLVKTLTQ